MQHTVGIDEKLESFVLSQSNYINNMLVKYKFDEANPRTTPLPPGIRISKFSPDENVAYVPSEENSQEFITRYRSAIGALLYLSGATRPDIAFAVNALSRYSHDPQPHHWVLVNEIFRYLRFTKSRGLRLTPTSGGVDVMVDADFGGDIDSGLSTSRVFVFFMASPVLWKSKKQKYPVTATAHAEYYALDDALTESLYVKDVIEGVMPWKKGSFIPTIWCDNAAAIQIASSDAINSSNRAIRQRFHRIRFSLKENEVELHKITTQENVADCLTKSLPENKLMFLAEGYFMSK